MGHHLTYNRLSIELSVLDGIHFEDKTEHNGSTVNLQQAIHKIVSVGWDSFRLKTVWSTVEIS